LKTPIIIAVHDELELTRRCVESVKRNSQNYELVIVDDKSLRDDFESFCKEEGFRLIKSDRNRGKTFAVNLALERLKEGQEFSEFVVLDNDTVVYEDWLKKLREVLRHDSEIGAVGPLSNWTAGDHQRICGFQALNPFSPTLKETLRKNGFDENLPRYRVVSFISFFCVLFRYKMVEEMGVLDTSFPWRAEDNEYALRIRNTPWKLAVRLDCFVYHQGRGTRRKKPFTDDPNFIKEVSEKLRAKYEGKLDSSQKTGEIIYL
jgi:GT2 family glycosyltransferase